MEDTELFRRIKTLTEEMSITEDEESNDALYAEYWNLIHDNINLQVLAQVEKRIGSDKFTTKEYYDALYDVYQKMPKVIDKYRNFVLKRTADCWGGVSYFVYLDGRQYSEALNLFSDDSAKRFFRAAIDDAPSSPDFFEV